MLLLWRRLQAGTGEPTGDILRRSLIEIVGIEYSRHMDSEYLSDLIQQVKC